MGRKNKFGLSRDIPDAIMREVRQRDGFGCVVCGLAIVDYDHVAPEFNEAREHSSSGIVSLCPGCHGRKTRGLLSTETILDAMQKPKAKQRGFSFDSFDIGRSHPVIVFGNVLARNTPVILRMNGQDVLSVRPPLDEGQPFLIDARFANEFGQKILWIDSNNWHVPISNWDVKASGRTIELRQVAGRFSLILRCDPPNKLTIERFRMMNGRTFIYCDGPGRSVFAINPITVLQSNGVECDGAQCVISIEPRNIIVGMGGGSIRMKGMVINPELNAEQKLIISRLNSLRRNSLCLCESGKRYKRCCGSLVAE